MDYSFSKGGGLWLIGGQNSVAHLAMPPPMPRQPCKKEAGIIPKIPLLITLSQHAREEYGEPEKHFAEVASDWTETLEAKVSAEKAVSCMISLKLKRLKISH